MAFALGPKATAAGYRLAAYETIGSTSTEALERARAGEAGRLWVVSRAQTAGHGRRGRAWETAIGNLAASLLLRLASPPALTATLGFVAGLALESAIRSTTPPGGRGVKLKWPNDVLVDGGKVSGILLQAVNEPAGLSSVVVGIGVNVLHAPGGLPYPATSLAASGARIGVEELFEALAEAWVEQESIWDCGRGFGTIRSLWLERAAGLGAPIAVRVGEDVVRGIFETIDKAGMLVVRAPDGTARKIAAGEVHFGPAATMGAVRNAS